MAIAVGNESRISKGNLVVVDLRREVPQRGLAPKQDKLPATLVRARAADELDVTTDATEIMRMPRAGQERVVAVRVMKPVSQEPRRLADFRQVVSAEAPPEQVEQVLPVHRTLELAEASLAAEQVVVRAVLSTIRIAF